MEATAVTPDGRFDEKHIGLWDDSQIEKHRLVTEACRNNGVVSLIQLNHTGIGTNPAVGRPIGPSSVPCRTGMSEEMSVDDIHRMQGMFETRNKLSLYFDCHDVLETIPGNLVSFLYLWRSIVSLL